MLSQTRNNKEKQRWESATKKWKRDRVRGDRVTEGNSNDGWVGEVREWIKEDRVTERTVMTGEMDRKKGCLKRRQNNRGNNCNGWNE